MLAVQHRAVNLPGLLDDILVRVPAMRVQEAEGGETLRSGTVHVALAHRHLLLAPDGCLRLSQSASVK